MSFSKMMELLQIKHKNKIVLCNAGEFYIAIGKDAILLSNILNLKLTCLKPEVCKVGFPITALEKYTEKFSIGTEYKSSMYQMLRDIMMVNKIEKNKVMYYLNKIDSNLNTQRIYLRIMKENKWIDKHKFQVAIEIYEIGKIIIKSHNKIADKCYNKLNKNNIVAIEGEIDSQMEIIANEIYIL